MNNHFSKQDDEAAAANGKASGKGCAKKSGAAATSGVTRKMVENNKSESTKNLKKAGVKLKYRPVVFSARIFDFFDASVMPGVRHANYNLSVKSADAEEITFTSKILAMRTNAKNGTREANVRWEPKDL